MEHAEAAIAKQWHSKQVSAAKNQHATTVELLKVVFSMWSVPTL
jgi:hypothetical protein